MIDIIEQLNKARQDYDNAQLAVDEAVADIDRIKKRIDAAMKPDKIKNRIAELEKATFDCPREELRRIKQSFEKQEYYNKYPSMFEIDRYKGNASWLDSKELSALKQRKAEIEDNIRINQIAMTEAEKELEELRSRLRNEMSSKEKRALDAANKRHSEAYNELNRAKKELISILEDAEKAARDIRFASDRASNGIDFYARSLYRRN